MTADLSTQTLSPARYKLLRQLGEGGVGKVFVAMDSETGQQVALETLPRMTPSNVPRFERELRALRVGGMSAERDCALTPLRIQARIAAIPERSDVD